MQKLSMIVSNLFVVVKQATLKKTWKIVKVLTCDGDHPAIDFYSQQLGGIFDKRVVLVFLGVNL